MTGGSDDHVAQIRAARADLDQVIREIQQVPGFESFLAAPSFNNVATAAAQKPLVYIVPTDDAGLALVVHGEEVEPVELPGLTTGVVRTFASEYLRAAEAVAADSPADSGEGLLAWSVVLDNLTRWLWDEAMGAVVRTVQPATEAVLVAGGLLGLFPLHAAWTDDTSAPTGRHYAMDDLALSYVPNARSLTAARERAAGRANRLVAITDPSPIPLPFATMEARAVAAAFGENGRVLPREQTTPESVLAALRTADVALLSCHAFADLAAPLESGFLLRGVDADHPERDAVLRLRDLLNEDLQLRLAVWSACETSLPGPELPDEVVALPTGLLQAGVGGVLATLWPVDDQPTCRLVLEFFRRMQYENQAPALALQGAQRWLRDTTSTEKISFYEDAEASAPWLVDEATEALWEDLYWQEDDERSDAGLNSWAAFMHVGA
jgi:hypothetical protein